MAVYKILTKEDPVLREKAISVKKVNAAVIRVLDNMRDTMYANDGIGLAAPQIGISKRIIVVDPGDNYIEVMNPEIIKQAGGKYATEGCLSVPGLLGSVKRFEKIILQGMDRHGQSITIEAEGLLARVLLHEIDHLNGVLFTDIATNIVDDDK